MKSELSNEIHMGIDEAGRGSVFGSMFVAGYVCHQLSIQSFLVGGVGVKDSKVLAPAKRDKMYEALTKNKTFGHAWYFDSVKASLIKEGNLNILTKEFTVTVIGITQKRRLRDEKDPVTHVFLDCPEQLPDVYASEINFMYKRDFPDMPKIVVKASHKADSLFPIVSAASIIAKTQRELETRLFQRAVEEILGYPVPVGSGYTSDQITRNFLRDFLGHKEIDPYFRHSWSTYKSMKRLLETLQIKRRIRRQRAELD